MQQIGRARSGIEMEQHTHTHRHTQAQRREIQRSVISCWPARIAVCCLVLVAGKFDKGGGGWMIRGVFFCMISTVQNRLEVHCTAEEAQQHLPCMIQSHPHIHNHNHNHNHNRTITLTSPCHHIIRTHHPHHHHILSIRSQCRGLTHIATVHFTKVTRRKFRLHNHPSATNSPRLHSH